jgi:hypothetical protein
MKKFVLSTLIASASIIAPVKNTQAMMGLGFAQSWNNVGTIALYSLRYIGPGYVVHRVFRNESPMLSRLGQIIIGFGILILDEGTGKMTFQEIDSEMATKLNISQTDVDVFNSEIDQVNVVFQSVISELDEKSSPEEALEVWEDYSPYLSKESFRVIKAMANQ